MGFVAAAHIAALIGDAGLIFLTVLLKLLHRAMGSNKHRNQKLGRQQHQQSEQRHTVVVLSSNLHSPKVASSTCPISPHLSQPARGLIWRPQQVNRQSDFRQVSPAGCSLGTQLPDPPRLKVAASLPPTCRAGHGLRSEWRNPLLQNQCLNNSFRPIRSPLIQ